MNAYHFGGGKSRWVPYAFLLPGLLLYVLIALGPSIATTFFSFTNATGIRGAPVASGAPARRAPTGMPSQHHQTR